MTQLDDVEWLLYAGHATPRETAEVHHSGPAGPLAPLAQVQRLHYRRHTRAPDALQGRCKPLMFMLAH
jgi:hypothetical protein